MNEPISPTQPERRSRRPLAVAVVALLALIGGCASWRIPRYIDDKVGRAQICLRDAKVDYRHLTLTPGLTSIRVSGLTSNDDRAAIEKALNACSGMGTVKFGDGSASGRPASQRFEWGTGADATTTETGSTDAAGMDTAGITISGTVRSEEERTRIVAAATEAADGASVTDHVEVGNVSSNAPTLDRLLTHLPRLRKLVDPALVTVSGTAVSITGVRGEADQDTLGALLADLANDGILPTLNLSKAASGADAASTEAALSISFNGDSAGIAGTVPSRADVLAIRSTIGQSYDTWNVTGLQVGASDTGSDSVKGLAAALPDIMSGLSAGRVTLQGETVTIEGKPGPDAQAALTSAVARLEKDRLTASVQTGDATLDALGSGTPTAATAPATTAPATTAPATTAPATTTPASTTPTTAPATTAAPAPTTTAPLSSTNKAISDQLAALVASSPIPFETGSATLGAGANTILDQIAGLLKQAAGVTVRIEGHTDSQGDPAVNQQLSEARANSVFEALAARGVARTSMTAAGLGDTKPIADNATAEGMAKNRRVVFVLSQQ